MGIIEDIKYIIDLRGESSEGLDPRTIPSRAQVPWTSCSFWTIFCVQVVPHLGNVAMKTSSGLNLNCFEVSVGSVVKMTWKEMLGVGNAMLM